MRPTLRYKLMSALIVLALFAPANLFAQTSNSTLYHVCVGVSKYPKMDAKGQLKAAHKDALDMAAFWNKQGQKQFSKVKYATLTDEKATKAGVLAALDRVIATAKPGDWAVVFLAGHGGFADTREEEWYFCTSNYDPNAMTKTALAGKVLLQKLSDLSKRGVTVFLMVDTCHSGALTRKQVPFVVMAACGAKQNSFEDDKLGHGMFTLALIEALSGKADANKDGKITLAELYNYTLKRVEGLTKSQQPILHRPATIAASFTLTHHQTPVLFGPSPYKK